MRFLLVPLLGIFLSSVAYSADDAAAESKIKSLLTTKKSWTMYLEFTDAPAPSDRANKFIWEYFERDGKVMGRRVGMAFGGCEVELSVRGDGFSFPWCDRQLSAGEPSLSYDPNDSKYPFKSREPRRLWLEAND